MLYSIMKSKYSMTDKGEVAHVWSLRMECEGNRITRREQVVMLRKTFHFPYRQRAELMGIPKSTVGDIIHRYETEYRIEDKPRFGRPRLLDEGALQRMNQWIQHRCITGRELAKRLQARVHKPISKQVANLYRRRLGYKGKRQRTKPPLSFLHRRQRLNWAKAHLHYRWKEHAFLDEHIFTLGGASRKVWVRNQRRLAGHNCLDTIQKLTASLQFPRKALAGLSSFEE